MFEQTGPESETALTLHTITPFSFRIFCKFVLAFSMYEIDFCEFFIFLFSYCNKSFCQPVNVFLFYI